MPRRMRATCTHANMLQAAQDFSGFQQHMRRALALLWSTPLAVRSPDVVHPLVEALARPMHLSQVIQRAALRPAGGRNVELFGRGYIIRSVHDSRSTTATVRRGRRRLLLRLSAGSQSSPSISTVEGIKSKAEQQKATASGRTVAASRTASSRYIPSNYRGVTGAPNGKWKARIVSKGGLRQLGTFGREVDAARAYNEAARALHGSAARLNPLPEEDGSGAQAATLEARADATPEHGSRVVSSVLKEEEQRGRERQPQSAERGGVAASPENVGRTRTPGARGTYAEAARQASPPALQVRDDSNASAALGGGKPEFATKTDEKGAIGAPAWETSSNVTFPSVANTCAAASVADAVPADLVFPDLDFRDLEEIPQSNEASMWDEEADLARKGSLGAETFRSLDISGQRPACDRVGRSDLDGVKPGRMPEDDDARSRDRSSAERRSEVPEPLVDNVASVPLLSPYRNASSAATEVLAAASGASRSGRPTFPATASHAIPSATPLQERPLGPHMFRNGASFSTTAQRSSSATQTAGFAESGRDGPGRDTSHEQALKAASCAPQSEGIASAPQEQKEDARDAWDNTSKGTTEQRGSWAATAGLAAATPGGWDRDETADDLYEERLLQVVDVSTGIHRYWMEPLMRLTKPETRKVAAQLSSVNKLGYQSSRGGSVGKGSLLEFVLQQKEKHPTKVLLTRVGEFYETYGVDAVMMMQHAGLNKMGQEIRAGCPRKNIQQTLDGLTGAGLTVAVYEEMSDVDAQRGPSVKTRIKERFLSQVVSPGSPNYLYEGCLRTDDISFRESKPYVGVMKDSSGFLLCQVYTDEREVQVSERMTEEAVRVAMEEAGIAEPVFDQGTGLSFLPDHTEQLTGFPASAFPGQVLSRVARSLELAETDLAHFRTVTRTPEGRPRPLYPSTALQIGLLWNPNVPDLVPCLLPGGYPAACHRFLRKWLLLPPSHRLADSAHNLCKELASGDQVGLPPLHAVPVGKAKALLLDRQCNVPFFREIHQCTRGMLDMLGDAEEPLASSDNISDGSTADRHDDPDAILTGCDPAEGQRGGGAGKYANLLPYLLDLVAYQSGVDAAEDHLRQRARAIIRSIEDVVAPGNGLDDITSDADGLVPDSFWRCNEANFRGSLSLNLEATQRAYGFVDQAASELCAAVKDDFPNARQDLTFDFHNNGIYLTKLPPAAKMSTSASAKATDTTGDDKGNEKNGATMFVHPIDRNGKVLPKRFTTHRVRSALAAYLNAVQETENIVKVQLQTLSDSLIGSNDLPVIAQAAHWSVICQAMEGHVRRALASGWSLPSLKDLGDPNMSMQVENLVPYWLPRGEAVPNSFDFRGLFLLTAPNMSGKSTLMRAILASSLLANAGLFVPCASAVIPRFDGFFLRTASYDIPAEDKSAFALEMDDVRVMLRDSSRRSLALVDELGKGTSARDGSALAGALLEEMDRVGITGVFATHLHELFDLPLETATLSYKRMGIDWDDEENPKWTYTMEDGKCTNSLALQTAKKYRIAKRIIARAEALSLAFDDICRGRVTGGDDADSVTTVEGPEKESIPAAVVKDVAAPAPRAGALGSNAAGWWPSEGYSWVGNGPLLFRSLAEVAQVVRRVTGSKESDILTVDSGYGTPPSLEGRSCLYVLRYAALVRDANRAPPALDVAGVEGVARPDPQLSIKGGSSCHAPMSGVAGASMSPPSVERGENDAEAGVWFYVGETDAIRERLRQHTGRWGGGAGSGGGLDPSSTASASVGAFKLDAIVLPVENRSEARRLETAMIRAMKAEGFYLVSDKDGSRAHFSSSGPVS